jgi:hypothetical protein
MIKFELNLTADGVERMLSESSIFRQIVARKLSNGHNDNVSYDVSSEDNNELTTEVVYDSGDIKKTDSYDREGLLTDALTEYLYEFNNLETKYLLNLVEFVITYAEINNLDNFKAIKLLSSSSIVVLTS